MVSLYTPPHDSGGVLCFHVGCPCVCPSVVCPSVRFSLPDDNLSKHQWIFTKLSMCIDIVEICLGLLMGKFHQIFTELSTCDTTVSGYNRYVYIFIYIFYTILVGYNTIV